eukprot:gnl/MRDRNA2_/MRDRNA2_171601_c0_seq1.p1 gnl/MRDRNA2_/MRDRNA2_171601_c0~~gnl/MRDRNA2_/MRDRNA2_171601_c0_seq1.p1  ORF type:complete len:1101 (+),score=247.80 gnl/MRDRNA2_/MRDRNA2_171601_c0_seq1:150-3452(+)
MTKLRSSQSDVFAGCAPTSRTARRLRALQQGIKLSPAPTPRKSSHPSNPKNTPRARIAATTPPKEIQSQQVTFSKKFEPKPRGKVGWNSSPRLIKDSYKTVKDITQSPDGCPEVLQVLNGPEYGLKLKGNSAVVPFWATVGAPALAVRSGRWYWEVKFRGAFDPQVGWADQAFLDQAKLANEQWESRPGGVGDCVNSWAVDGMRKLRWHAGEYGDYQQAWQGTCTIGCAISLDERLMLFSKNGVWDDVPAFKEIQFSEMLFPAVSGEFESITFSFFRAELTYAPPASFLPLVPCQFFNAYQRETLNIVKCSLNKLQLKKVDVDDARKQCQQENEKKIAQRMRDHRNKDKIEAVNAIVRFKIFLKKMFGHIFRAWRRCLDPEGHMVLTRAEFFKAVKTTRWNGNVRAVWHGLDLDNSGRTDLAELDPKFARILAFFKVWVDLQWGSASKAYRSLCNNPSTHKIHLHEFEENCRRFGYEFKVRSLFFGLDTENKKYLNELDFQYIDNFKPPKWLTAMPSEKAKSEFQTLLLKKYNNFLKAWKECLDIDNSNCITFDEFSHAAEKLGFKGDVGSVWLSFDDDLSGYITLNELDHDLSETLLAFKIWAEEKYGHVTECLRLLDESNRGYVSRVEFIRGVPKMGFSGNAEILFDALDTDHGQELSEEELLFLDEWLALDSLEEKAAQSAEEQGEIHRLQQMEASDKQQELAKTKARWQALRRHAGKAASLKAHADFKRMLKQKFGHLFRAWRNCLDVNMTWHLKKGELFKICQQLCWKGSVAALWNALDADGSGQTTFEELDQRYAAKLAHFQKWLLQSFHTSQRGFRRLDTTHHHMLHLPEFEKQCRHHGFQRDLKEVFVGLDMEGKGFLTDEDFKVLDFFNPPDWLTAEPNAEACKAFKEMLLKKYGDYLKAWRHCLDLTQSNCVDWREFQKAAANIGFDGDVAGAWVALDGDHSGHISLHEIDEKASKLLLEFKSFCDEKFGGVCAAFHAIDKDGSGSCSRAEFCSSSTLSGFEGDRQVLFDAFDADVHGGTLSLKEVVWLDEWHTEVEELHDEHSFDHSRKSLAPGHRKSMAAKKQPAADGKSMATLKRASSKKSMTANQK